MRLHPILCQSDTRASRRASHQARLEPSTEAIHERAVVQDVGPISIRTIRRSDTQASCQASHQTHLEPPAEVTRTSRRARYRAHLEPCAKGTRASRRARCRARLEPSAEAIHKRAVGQDAGPVSIRTIHRSDTRASRRASRRARLEPPTKATRVSCQARCRARLEPSAEAIHERAVGQDAGPVSIRTICQSATSDPSSKLLPQSCARSGAQAAASGRRRY